MEKVKNRLKVFQRITGDYAEPVPSRQVEISGFQDVDKVILDIFSFGDVQMTRICESGCSVCVRFFDIRPAKELFRVLEGRYSVKFGIVEDEEFVRVDKEEYIGVLPILQGCGEISEVKVEPHEFLVYFFDVRAARTAFCLMNSQNERKSESNAELESSFLSDSTSPSPYLIPLSPSTSTENSFEENRKRKKNDESLFKINLDSVVKNQDKRTSVMIRNIPNKYTQSMLIETINKFFFQAYDFFYLPIDFKNKCNVGYAFINLKHYSMIPKLFREFNGKKWERFNSEKICALSYARIQGKQALLNHLQTSSVMAQGDSFKPVVFL